MKDNSSNHNAAMSAEVQAILVKYGEAMMRLGQVERELEQLRQQANPSASPSQTNNQELSELLQGKDKEIRRKDETIASLKLNISVLTDQLARTEEKLKAAAVGNYMLHRRRRRKWWQFWVRRHRDS